MYVGLVCISDVGNWREGGGRNIPAAVSTDDDSATQTAPSAVGQTASTSETDETPQPPYPATVMPPHMMRPGMGPPPRMGPGGPMMFGMMPPFVSDNAFHSRNYMTLFNNFLLLF